MHAFYFELGVVSEEISPAKHEHVNIQTPFPDKALASFALACAADGVLAGGNNNPLQAHRVCSAGCICTKTRKNTPAFFGHAQSCYGARVSSDEKAFFITCILYIILVSIF